MKGMRAAAAIVTGALLATGCTIQRQEAPELSGPSELATSVQLTATPDRLVQDGVSQAVINALVRDHQSQPMAGLGIQWSVSASDGQHIAPSSVMSVTDAQGRASTIITAPGAPSQLPTSPVRLVVSATPLGTDSASATPRTIVVDLVPPGGTPSANRNPVPAFSIVPAVANVNQSVTFDASNTMDEGVICGGRCSYMWDFGDFTTGGGVSISHTYTLPNTYTVTLTVVDDRGGVASTSRSLSVNGPTPPVAQFVVTPTAPVAPNTGAQTVDVTFDASASSVGAGATIAQYEWTFGGSAAIVSTTPVVVRAFGAGTHTVTLVVTDSLGRKATRATALVVTQAP